MTYVAIEGSCYKRDRKPVQMVEVYDSSVSTRPVLSVPCPAWANPFVLSEIARTYYERKETAYVYCSL